MEKVQLLNIKGEKLKDIKLDKEIFGIEPNNKVLYDAISGGGRKPWRQKGTGHARQGSIRSVQWVGGGTYGGPVPRDYSKKMNRKERRIAIKSALATIANEERVIAVEKLVLSTPKTKEMMGILETLKIEDKKVLIVVNELEENVILATRNIPNVLLLEASEINVLDVVNADVMLVEEEALKSIEEGLK